MAKGKYISWMPGYSIQAWGRFYGVYPFGYPYPHPAGAKGYSIFQRRPTAHGIICIKEKYYQPTDPKTEYQLNWRDWFASGVKEWQTLSADDKEAWKSYSYPLQMSGYNKFLHYYLERVFILTMFKREDSVIKKTIPTDTIEFGDNGNKTRFKEDGEIELLGTARVERHHIIGAASLKKGAIEPGEGWMGLTPTLDFADGKDDAAHYLVHVPYRRDSDTNMTVEIRWAHDTVAKTGKVLWKCTYLSAGVGDDPAAGGTELSVLTDGDHAESVTLSAEMTAEILAANLTPMDDLILKIWRNDGAGGDTLTEAARLISIHTHFTQNKLGKAT